MRPITTAFSVPVLLVLALLQADCGGWSDPSARRLPHGFRLVQKGRYQALYGRDGRIQRLLEDRDGDGQADAVILYGANGRPERGEIDTDADGVVDRWELFRADGSLEVVSLDVDGDGRPDRAEYPAPPGS